MKINRVVTLYFSPTQNTKKVCESVAKAFDGEKKVMNRTGFESRWEGGELYPEDLVIIGMPVYYGRIPRIKKEFFRGIRGNHAKAVYIVTYGNREYEDALLELKDACEKMGFESVAAAAFAGEHSFSAKIGAGRPNDADEREALEFGKEVQRILGEREHFEAGSLKVKGNRPYTPAPDLPVCPAVSDACQGCGLCARQCPVFAINPDNPRETDGFRCLNCALCVRNCPSHARAFTVPAMVEKITIMEHMFTEPKKNEVFFAQKISSVTGGKI